MLSLPVWTMTLVAPLDFAARLTMPTLKLWAKQCPFKPLSGMLYGAVVMFVGGVMLFQTPFGDVALLRAQPAGADRPVPNPFRGCCTTHKRCPRADGARVSNPFRGNAPTSLPSRNCLIRCFKPLSGKLHCERERIRNCNQTVSNPFRGSCTQGQAHAV